MADNQPAPTQDGIVTRLKLTKHWTDWVDYWAVDFDYIQRKETIKAPIGTGAGGIASLPGLESPLGAPAMRDLEERWTGGTIFENEWQSFRTRQNRDLELTTVEHTYQRRGERRVIFRMEGWKAIKNNTDEHGSKARMNTELRALPARKEIDALRVALNHDLAPSAGLFLSVFIRVHPCSSSFPSHPQNPVHGQALEPNCPAERDPRFSPPPPRRGRM